MYYCILFSTKKDLTSNEFNYTLLHEERWIKLRNQCINEDPSGSAFRKINSIYKYICITHRWKERDISEIYILLEKCTNRDEDRP